MVIPRQQPPFRFLSVYGRRRLLRRRPSLFPFSFALNFSNSFIILGFKSFLMANHSYQIKALCLHALLLSKGLSLLFLIKNLISSRDLSLVRFTEQFDQKLSRHMTKSSLLQCCSSPVMLIRWNHDVLPCRRFVSGAFSRCRCIFRLITGDCPLTQRYGGFTWVFDPGIKGCINLLDRIRFRDRIGYASRTVWRLSFILGTRVLVMLILSDDGDVFSLRWLEYFILLVNCMGCGAFGFKVKVHIFSDDDDDGDNFLGRKPFFYRIVFIILFNKS